MKPEKLYFKNLNGLRFIAAMMVLYMHCYFFTYGEKIASSTFFGHFFRHTGTYGVKLFFVLSGFLITYLLLNEQKTKNRINIKNFYIRRTLRIWPLYFLVGIGGTIAGPLVLSKLGIAVDNSFLWENLAYVMVFGINFQLIFDTFNRGIVEILWSVCIEEQFYLIWPWLIILFRKNLLPILVITTLIGVATPFIFDFIGNKNWNSPAYFFTTSAFSMFGTGGILAYALFKNYWKENSFIYKKWFQILILSLTIGLCFNVFFPLNDSLFFKKNLSNIASALLFGMMIIQLISKNALFSLENKWLNEGGKISYGIYVYHTFVAQIIIRLLPKMGVTQQSFLYEIVCPILVALLTIIISYVSYYTFEKFFLNFKKKFT